MREAFIKSFFLMLVFALNNSLKLCYIALAFWYSGQFLKKRKYNIMQFFIIYIAVI